MSTIKITIGLTDEYRQSQFIQTGKLPAPDQVVEYDLTQATPEQRAIIARATNGTLKDLRLVDDYPKWTCYNGLPDLDILTATLAADLDIRDEKNRESLVKVINEKIDSVRRSINEHQPELPSWCRLDDKISSIKRLGGIDLTAYNAAIEEYERLRPAFVAEKAEREARLEAEKTAREQQKRQWIAKHGSEHLKRAYKHHNCQRKYITERAAIEAPGYVVDFDDSAAWKERSCPSIEALDELDAAIEKAIGDPKIVWLTATGDEETDYGFAGCEAVVIQNYQGKYDLIKLI